MSHFELNGSSHVIEPDLVLQKMRSGQPPLIIDVRSTEEFRRGHIPGSRLYPIDQLVARTCEIAPHRSDLIVLVSRGEGRSKVAASALRLAAFGEVFVLAGGIRRWREHDYPIEDTSAPALTNRAHTTR